MFTHQAVEKRTSELLLYSWCLTVSVCESAVQQPQNGQTCSFFHCLVRGADPLSPLRRSQKHRLNLFLSRHSHVEEESEREEVDELEGAERADAHAQSQLME